LQRLDTAIERLAVDKDKGGAFTKNYASLVKHTNHLKSIELSSTD